MESGLLIHLGGVNNLIASEDKYYYAGSNSREFGVLRDRRGALDFGVKSRVTFFILLLYHLYYMAKIPQMLFGDISIFVKILLLISPKHLGNFGQ